MTSMAGCTIHLLSSFFLSILIMSTATDTITKSLSLRDGNTLISAGGSFVLGFFRPGTSMKRYLGIWYKKISTQTVVWVANREIPLNDSSGALKVTRQGNIVLLDGNLTLIWSSNSSLSVPNPVSQLLDSGNLVVRDENDDNPKNYLWQSFDYPADTFLPGMKLGKNLVTGLDRYISSWKSSDDPSIGSSTLRLEPHGFPELIVTKDSVRTSRLGPWNGLRFSGIPELKPNLIYSYDFVNNQEEIYYHYELTSSSKITRLLVNPNGTVQRVMWTDISWAPYFTVPIDNCDQYALCRTYGRCSIYNTPLCECLKGFVPKNPIEWDMQEWTKGCVRKVPLDCKNGGDGFNKYSGLKLPETQHSRYNDSMNLEECKIVCLKNCSCTAYATLDIKRGTGCLLWFDELIDIREFDVNGQDIFIRMAASELDRGDTDVKKRVKIIIMFGGLLLLSLALIFYGWRKKRNRAGEVELGLSRERRSDNENLQDDLELPLFDLSTLANATDNFSIDNKIGEGGFGPVYKGVLEDGQEIAVKRLSKTSVQGLNEFKNEVIHINKLQHRNLVKLLGCCIQVDEMMLIYEFLSNKSLDSFIFDHKQSILLDWPMRFHIINGIAQGLLYLHRDSRLRIIHRDLKAGNILLDNEMNPKISDFGLSRSFSANETKANTNKVVGTYGYMSPEYAIDGLYSLKSDVFSFGVLLLEIVSGKRNRGFFHPDHYLNLLGHAWRLYMEGRSSELIDASLANTLNLSEVLRSIHVGLLCVQRSPEDRPSMSLVVLMLCSNSTLSQPNQPGFYNERNLVEESSSSSKHETYSRNEITITLLGAR